MADTHRMGSRTTPLLTAACQRSEKEYSKERSRDQADSPWRTTVRWPPLSKQATSAAFLKQLLQRQKHMKTDMELLE